MRVGTCCGIWFCQINNQYQGGGIERGELVNLN